MWQHKGELDGEAFNFGPGAQQDMTVADLLEEMATRWPGAHWQVASGADQVGREATFLRLSCAKALQRLDWHAVMEFPSTVALTIDWYRAWQNGETDLNSFTVGQIEHYTDLARATGVAWSKT